MPIPAPRYSRAAIMAGSTSRSSSLDTGTLTAKNTAASRADRIASARFTAHPPKTRLFFILSQPAPLFKAGEAGG